MHEMITPRIRITLDDGMEHDVQTDNRDAVRFDMLRARMGWPSMSDAPVLWATVMAWSALARAGKMPTTCVADQLDRIVSVEPLEDVQAADPTSPAA